MSDLEQLEHILTLMAKYKISKLEYKDLKIEKTIHENENKKPTVNEELERIRREFAKDVAINSILLDEDLYAAVSK